jgi:uncharacterized pyridoxamine 5'-phosphate oxidase family protein
MNLKEILTITGKPGLFKSVAQSKNGFIVESLIDGKRSQAFTTDKISSLSEISVFTLDEDKPLVDVFKQMKDKEAELKVPDAKTDDKNIKKYFETVLPEYDRERVYVSHMRKILNWYNLLVSKDILEFSPAIPEESITDSPEPTES